MNSASTNAPHCGHGNKFRNVCNFNKKEQNIYCLAAGIFHSSCLGLSSSSSVAVCRHWSAELCPRAGQMRWCKKNCIKMAFWPSRLN